MTKDKKTTFNEKESGVVDGKPYTPTVFESLLEIQKELKTVTKDKKSFKGSYATIENVWQSIRGIINNNHFVVTHSSDEKGVTTIAMHISGEKLQSFMPWSGNTDSQEQGKEMTYARRYGINAIFNVIVADEDTDAAKPMGNYKKKEIDGTLAAKKLKDAKTHEEALAVYKTLSADERQTKEVVQELVALKEKYKNV